MGTRQTQLDAVMTAGGLLRVRDAFDKFVGPEIRDAVLRPSARTDRLQEVTILFADLRDFSGWVASTPPEEVAEGLNAYFTEMEGAIRRHGGLVLQFIGDEIEAVFGAPLRWCTAHADMAVAAALEMRERLSVLNTQRALEGRRALRHGIGVHTGTVLAGVIGSANRLFYALVGDAVNVASRIQELNKGIGSDILVSESTRRRAYRQYDFVKMEATMLRGRAESVTVYQVR